MNFENLDIKRAYSSDSDDIIHDFYIPVLENAVEYNRLAGFFTSTSLAIAAKGIMGLIRNGGLYKLLVSAKLSKQDVEVLVDSQKRSEDLIEEKMIEELEHIEDAFVRDHVFALGWMVANKKLEIKVATACTADGELLSYKNVLRSGLFHQKVGILKDAKGNTVTFSGSINETAKGWLENIEEFKVFRDWKSGEQEYVVTDIAKFEKFWNNESPKIRTIDVPQAVKMKLIEIAPSDISTVDLSKWYKKREPKKIKLFDHQNKAIAAWFENDKKGIFEMATGTGKTFTALGCLKRLAAKEQHLLTVIACPYNHLIRQWLDDIMEFGLLYDCIIADSSNYQWKHELANYLLDLKSGVGNQLIVLTTHDTFPTDNFTQLIRSTTTKRLLIVDEVHGIGAPYRKRGLKDEYIYRLGLSATPKRWFDEEGSKKVYDYFGGTVYEFSLADAINTINPVTGESFLAPYEYKPYFVFLTAEELQQYEEETTKIVKLYHGAKLNEERDKWFSLLCIKRQKIITNCINKYEAFKSILDKIGQNIKYCLVYCSENQIDHVRKILSDRNIIASDFTQKEGTKPAAEYDGLSEREFLLQEFSNSNYKVLISMKCLDEGIDIPEARIGIIMASSGNPRQYIQRRGRLLRRSPAKKQATIYDILVMPPTFDYMPKDLMDLEKRIIRKELKRYKEFANIAMNDLECLNKIFEIENRYNL